MESADATKHSGRSKTVLPCTRCHNAPFYRKFVAYLPLYATTSPAVTWGRFHALVASHRNLHRFSLLSELP
jgi:cytochrome c553